MTVTPDSETKRITFTEMQASQRLRELAKNPVDLTSQGLLTPERMKHFSTEACGLRLIYGMQKIDDKVIDALFDLADEADVMGKMQRMQSGGITNVIHGYPSEERPVLHTAMRDLFGEEESSEIASKATKFAKAEHQKLKNFLLEIEDEKDWQTLLLVGIGGSNLGPEALYESLEYLQRPDRSVHFISNIDPDNVAAVIEGMDLSKALVGVISKSGTTLETVSNEAFLRNEFEKQGLDSNRHFISITGKGSPMDDSKRYRASFFAENTIGGRFSATAVYGGISLSFGLGYDTFLEMLEGAHRMDLVAREQTREKNLPLLMALLGIWNHNFLGHPTLAIIPYSYALRRFSAHIQQVDMESNGKHIDQWGRRVDFKTGPIIWGEPGTNAQHSFFQLLHQGTEIVPMDLIGFRESQRKLDHECKGSMNQEKLCANLVAQAIALAQGQENENPNKRFEGNRPSNVLLTKRLTPRTMGSLFALYEHKVAFQGFIWGINSFDQEGVQLGKVLANQVLDSIEQRDADKSGTYPLADAFLDQWGQL